MKEPDIMDYLRMIRERENAKREEQRQTERFFAAVNANHERAVMPSEGVERVRTLRRLGLC